jgi:UDP-N-acetylmuramoyl-tripeptide--D-alanyl-D-alanine ligase
MKIPELYELFLQHRKVVIDSRKVESGCMFFALKGANFDGNKFASDAINNGAAYAIIDNPEYEDGERTILVEDVLQTLQDLSHHHRLQIKAPVIGLTGSNGKTTSKELISSVLAQKYRVHFTKGNFNNHIGVPLTLLEMPNDTEIAVIEMGANHQGEIDFLSNIAAPSHGLITNIGKAHLEGFGGIEGVKKGKSELYRYLSKSKGLAFLNLDEPFLKELLPEDVRKIEYSSIANQDFSFQLISNHPFLKVAYKGRVEEAFEMDSQLMGQYNYANIITAATIGLYFKVSVEAIKKGISSYIPSNNRSQIVQKEGYELILDAYNANPNSMKLALENLQTRTYGKKIAILGHMLELGNDSSKEHDYIASICKENIFDQVVLIGNEFKKAADTNGFLFFENVEKAKAWFEEQNFKDASVLIKGSRGVGLEKLVQ